MLTLVVNIIILSIIIIGEARTRFGTDARFAVRVNVLVAVVPCFIVGEVGAVALVARQVIEAIMSLFGETLRAELVMAATL